ncbi:DUF1294 domain-containing protein [Paenibacillus agricola]|uniref:DUF1294 domain-containing protein n=1 Tax=Paenibacillus agricola TaxID=2716264 RepID=UPI001A9FF4B4|nr:DUF1294 domain-containing protein [Paenibacillus agricola]
MNNLYVILAIILIIMNVIGFIRMGQDKQYAKKRRRRVSERQLFMIALLGGAIGSWIGMRVWRHKTNHRSFTIGIPLLVVVNVGVIYLAITYLN